MVQVKDYYQTLGVAKDASPDEVKQAFRKLARKYHPDAAPNDPTAADRFKEINEAYEVLSDADKRKKYDQFGAEWQHYSQAGGDPNNFDWSRWNAGAGNPYGQQQGQTGYRTVSPEEFETMFGGSGGFSDFFESLFGGGRRSAGTRTTGGFSGFDFGDYAGAAQPRGQDAEHTLEISLYEAYSGTRRTLTWENGRTIEAKIPAGVKTGSKVRLAGQGYNGGDLYLNITVAPDPRFEREGDNLRVRQPVDLYTAILGGSVRVQGIDKSIDLKIPAGTQNGKTFRLKDMGMPKVRKPGERGALYVTVDIRLPEKLSAEEIRLFEQLRSLRHS